MQLSQYIINDIKPLDLQQMVGDAQELFSQLTYSHVPIANDSVYMGMLPESDAHCIDGKKKLSEYGYAIDDFFVRDTTHYLDVLEKFAMNDANIMPVLDSNNKYLGYYEIYDVMSTFSETPFLSEAGSVIIIEKGYTDYSFSEIAQIVESNDSKLFGCFVSKTANDLVEITLKVSSESLNEILQTLRRYSYTILSSAHDDNYLKSLQERSEYLSKYLDL